MSYSIPSYNYSNLFNLVVKFNAKAAKNGLAPLYITKISTNMVEEKDNKLNISEYVEYTEFNLTGTIPVINGWKIIAAVDHIDGVNVINKFPGIEIELPVEFYSRNPYCDHCNTRKIKKHSILIQNIETSEYKHVGKTCLKDFFNKDVDYYIAYFSDITNLFTSIDGEFSERMSSYEIHYDIKEILQIAFCSIRQWGYIKSSEMGSTKSSINYYFDKGAVDFKFIDEDSKNVEKAIEWLSNQSPSDFINNLNNLVKIRYISYKYFGYVAGLAGCYLKSVSENSNKVAINNEFVGNIGKRENFVVKLLNKMAIESYYGVSYLHIFLDNNNHKLSWFSSRGTDMEVDEIYTIKGTVKSHKEYKGENQTQLTRVTVI